MRFFADSNVLLALVLEAHPHHAAPRAWLDSLPPGSRLEPCRATRLSFLPLLTTEAILKSEIRTNDEALLALDEVLSDPRVGCLEQEPGRLFARWRELGGWAQPAPKRWMDAYLAAFALESDCRLVTFDRGFSAFVSSGLDLVLVPDA